jgi:hypothetical protein
VALLAFVGLAILGLLALAPALAGPVPWLGWHGASLATQQNVTQATERLTTIGALVFLLAAPGYWLGLGHRSLAVAAVVVGLVYAGIAGLGSTQKDLLTIALILAFLVFAVAGFNLVFVLEDLIYAAHRQLPHDRHGLAGAPFFVLLGLCFFLPWWPSHAGLSLPSLWVATMAAAFVLGVWWFIRLVNGLDRRGLVLRELHLLVSGALAAALLADLVGYIVGVESVLPTFLAYVTLLGTWVYASYVTLQRTHSLMPGRGAAPWAALLLAGTYAIVSHLQILYYEQDPLAAVTDVFRYRMAYMIFGIWIGLAFYLGRGLWRSLRAVLQLRTMPAGGRHVAEQAVRMAAGVRATERAMGQAARGLYLGLDRAIPGSRRRRHPAGWEVDAEGVHVIGQDGDDEEE